MACAHTRREKRKNKENTMQKALLNKPEYKICKRYKNVYYNYLGLKYILARCRRPIQDKKVRRLANQNADSKSAVFKMSSTDKNLLMPSEIVIIVIE